jgi:glycosyltransferase involved in cell wall biosynthesis
VNLKQPFFSICVPNYNYGHFIGDTLKTILEQDYPHFEIIVADNASTDNSVEVVESFMAQDERIRLIRNRYNIGFAPNLQRATETAKGDFINLLSSDDQMKPGALRAYAEAIAATRREDAVIFSAVENFDNTDKAWRLTVKPDDGFYMSYATVDQAPSGDPQVYEGKTVLADALKRLKTPMPFLSTVYSRSLWEAVEGYNSTRTIGPDKHFIYKVLSQNPAVIYIPRVLYRYRDYVSNNRAAQSTTLKQPIDDYLYTIEYRDDFLKELGLSRQTLIKTFIDRVCLREGLSQLGRRNYTHAFKLFAFAFASYPGAALRNKKTYGLGALLLTGPFATLIAPALLGVYYKQNPNAARI